jgi:uncharacterized membrane protein YfcA
MSDFLYFLLAGAGAGFLAGLFGIGGGLVMVPVLALVLASQVSADAVLPLALGTSLAAIVFSAASSAWGHYRRGAVELALVRNALPLLLVGAVAGAVGASWAPHALLTILLAVFQAGVCVHMVRKTYYPSGPTDTVVERPHSNSVLGLIGAICAMAGIGGGTLCVPYFTHLGVAPRKAVGTASAVGIPIALAAALAFAIAGLVKGVDLPDSVGYVHLIALAGMVPGVIAGAQGGTALAHRLQPKVLMGLFCAFLALASAQALAAVLS